MIRLKTTSPDSEWVEFEADSFLVLNDHTIRMKDENGEFFVTHTDENHTWLIEEVD